MPNKKTLFNLANIYFLISTILVTYFTVAFGTVAGQVDTGSSYGLSYLATFTVESNIFLGLTALVSLIATRKNKPNPTLYLIAATLVV